MSAPTPLRAKVRYPVCPLASQLGLATITGCGGRPETRGGVFGAAAVLLLCRRHRPRCLFFLPSPAALSSCPPSPPPSHRQGNPPPASPCARRTLAASTSCVAKSTKPLLAISPIVRCTCSTQGLKEQQHAVGPKAPRRGGHCPPGRRAGQGSRRPRLPPLPGRLRTRLAWMSLSLGTTKSFSNSPCLSNSSRALAALPA